MSEPQRSNADYLPALKDALEGLIRGWPLYGLPNLNGAAYVDGGTVNG